MQAGIVSVLPGFFSVCLGIDIHCFQGDLFECDSVFQWRWDLQGK